MIIKYFKKFIGNELQDKFNFGAKIFEAKPVKAILKISLKSVTIKMDVKIESKTNSIFHEYIKFSLCLYFVANKTILTQPKV